MIEERVLEHLPQVQAAARRIHYRLPPHVLLEDLVHAGILGLIDAVRKFDPSKNVELKHYAAFRIRGAIFDSLRRSWTPVFEDLTALEVEMDDGGNDPFLLALHREMTEMLEQAIGELPDRERQAVVLYDLHELNMKEVAALMGVGESRVSQIHTAAFARLRARLRELLERPGLPA